MLSPTEFSKEEAQRAKGLRDALCECGHEPDEVHVAEDVRMGNVVEAVYGVEGDEEALDTATSVIDDLPDEQLPDTFYYANGRATTEPEVGPADLGVIWKSLEPADVEEPEPADMGVVWKDLTPSDFPEAWREVEEAEDMGFATLVELMVSHLKEHQLLRVAEALNAECLRRDSWTSWSERWSLPLPGGWKVALLSREEDEGDNRADNVARTPAEDPRGDA